jgi:RNA polymerase sigma factor (sigma-70 family)
MHRRVVEQAQRGDRDAFGSLALEVSGPLFGIAHRILRDFDAASDALQVALVRMWRDLPALRDPDRFEAWAYRVLLRACHDELRDRRRREPELRVVAPDREDVPDPLLTVVNRELLERAFRKLTIAQRATVVLQYYRDLTLSEIAEVLGVPVGTVRSRLHYAKRTLRMAIQAEDEPVTREEQQA